MRFSIVRILVLGWQKISQQTRNEAPQTMTPHNWHRVWDITNWRGKRNRIKHRHARDVRCRNNQPKTVHPRVIIFQIPIRFESLQSGRVRPPETPMNPTRSDWGTKKLKQPGRDQPISTTTALFLYRLTETRTGRRAGRESEAYIKVNREYSFGITLRLPHLRSMAWSYFGSMATDAPSILIPRFVS